MIREMGRVDEVWGAFKYTIGVYLARSCANEVLND